MSGFFDPFGNSSGGGGTSSKDEVARAEIAAIKDGETLDSFGDVEAALADKADITDIPTIPITAIQKNGTDITPVSGTVNIVVPTQASDINAATATQGGKADTAIQGIKVNSSTVNPDANKVVNITVPTSAADVSALPDTTKYAAALSLTINSSTFVITGQLKDQNGDNLGIAQSIDLPLESVVVGGRYNSQTKKVILTLQNGNTIEFSVADLVLGLQTELSANNKLNPAYINYDSTHRAVSDTEKSTWNSKQNALTTAQLAAVNSGIDSTKVAQIETNENNILLKCVYCTCRTASSTAEKVVNAPNGFVLQSGCIIGVLFSNNNAAANVTLNVGGTGAISIAYGITRPYRGTFTKITGYKDAVNYYMYDGSYWVFLANGITYSNMAQSEASAGSSTTDRLITAKVLSDTIDEKLIPVENNILLLEQANGSKNQINIPNGTYVAGTSSFSVSGGAVTSTATDNNTHAAVLSVFTLKAGTYVFFDDSSDLSAVQYRIYQQSPDTRLTPAGQNPATFTIANDTAVYLSCYTFKTGTMTTHPMLVTKTMWDAGFTDYQPYALSNAELTAKEQSNENNILSLEQMNGAKNKFNYDAWKNCGVFQGTKTVNGNSFTLVASGEDCFTYYENNEPRQYPINARIPCNAGDKVVLTWEYTPLSSQSNDRVGIFANGSASTGFFALVPASNKKLEFTAPTGTTYLSIRFGVRISGNSATYGNIQIQSKASYDAGFTDYQPYAMSNAELTQTIGDINTVLEEVL